MALVDDTGHQPSMRWQDSTSGPVEMVGWGLLLVGRGRGVPVEGQSQTRKQEQGPLCPSSETVASFTASSKCKKRERLPPPLPAWAQRSLHLSFLHLSRTGVHNLESPPAHPPEDTHSLCVHNKGLCSPQTAFWSGEEIFQ